MCSEIVDKNGNTKGLKCITYTAKQEEANQLINLLWKGCLDTNKRIDEEEFASCDFKLMMRLASLYKKNNLNLLIKLIRKEYHHE